MVQSEINKRTLPHQSVRRLVHAHIRASNTSLAQNHFIPGLWDEAAQMNNTNLLNLKLSKK